MPVKKARTSEAEKKILRKIHTHGSYTPSGAADEALWRGLIGRGLIVGQGAFDGGFRVGESALHVVGEVPNTDWREGMEARKKKRAAAKKKKKKAKRAMRNPRKKYIGHMGDMGPIEHGGGIIYQIGDQSPEILYFQPWGDGSEHLSVYNWPVDDPRDDLGWVDWGLVSRTFDLSMREIDDLLDSPNTLKRAAAYELAGMYGGFAELTAGYETTTTIPKAERKYGRMVDAAIRAASKARTRI